MVYSKKYIYFILENVSLTWIQDFMKLLEDFKEVFFNEDKDTFGFAYECRHNVSCELLPFKKEILENNRTKFRIQLLSPPNQP